MNLKVCAAAAALLITSACQSVSTPATTIQSQAEIASCLRTVMKLDEGRWAYMGTIARLNGTFRTYQTTSIHADAGPDTWSSKSFGGDIADTEETAETGLVKLVGASIIPMEDGVLQEAQAINYLSCIGPDKEGRYEARLEYPLPNGDGTFDTAKNTSWYSEQGSYYAEDIYNTAGRVVARRSGVNTPASEK